jgi:cofilin
MSSGVAVADECLNVFQDLKLKKKYKYILYKLASDNSCIEVEKTVEEAGSYDDFVRALPVNDCRYAVYDFEYDTGGDGLRNKICFYSW